MARVSSPTVKTLIVGGGKTALMELASASESHDRVHQSIGKRQERF